jgi:glutaconyl-CoA decarboxylase
MLRSLKNGEFDDAIDRHARGAPAPSPVVAAVVSPPAVPPVRPPVVLAPPGPTAPAATRSVPAGPPPAATPPPAPLEASLDEIILSYLMGKDK